MKQMQKLFLINAMAAPLTNPGVAKESVKVLKMLGVKDKELVEEVDMDAVPSMNWVQ